MFRSLPLLIVAMVLAPVAAETWTDTYDCQGSAQQDAPAQAASTLTADRSLKLTGSSVDLTLKHTETNQDLQLKTTSRDGGGLAIKLVDSVGPRLAMQGLAGAKQQLESRLAGIQDALRRLMAHAEKRGGERAAADTDIQEAVHDAETRSLEMFLDLLVSGWGGFAPGLSGGLSHRLERDLARVRTQIDQVYREAAAAKELSKMAEYNAKAALLIQTALRLEEAIHQVDTYTERLRTQSGGDVRSSLEATRKVLDMLIGDPAVPDAVAVQAGASAIDSFYDVFTEAGAAQELRRQDDNSTQFLAAQKVLRQIKVTVAQLGCYKLPDPGDVNTCVTGAGLEALQ